VLELLDQQRGCAMISPLRNSKGDGTGAVNVAAASGFFFGRFARAE
jgi:hypothetical protein